MNWIRTLEARRARGGLGGAALAGCTPSGGGQADEEREPHFLEGKSRVSSMDYKAAIESFEESLEANPHFGVGPL